MKFIADHEFCLSNEEMDAIEERINDIICAEKKSQLEESLGSNLEEQDSVEDSDEDDENEG